MRTKKESARSIKHALVALGASAVVAGAAFVLAYGPLPSLLSVTYSEGVESPTSVVLPPPPPPLDTRAYDTKLLALAHVATTSLWYRAFLAGTTTVTLPNSTTTVTVASKPWPVRAAYPADGRALLPFNRIVAYYGNFYSRAMGALGQYDPPEMLERLLAAADEWRAADPTTPVIPALDYIAVVAQGSAGKDGLYRARMPAKEIEKAVALAEQINGVVFLDVQVGLSDLPAELPPLAPFLKLHNVHLSIDPEFSMKTGVPPGHVIGTFDATDVNYAAQFLADLVRQYKLPPKILVVHRFTEDMVTNYQEIKPLPEVQVVIHMDGWGYQAKKFGTYTYVVAAEPVQFTGFKLFYKNDTLASSTLLAPEQILDLTPAPIYIQYQ